MDVIYLDSLFGLNLLIDYCLVLVSARVCGVVLHRWRYALAALIGALYAALMVLPGFGWLANGMMKLALGAAMALTFPEIAFNGYSLLLPRMLGFYLTHLLLIVCGISLTTLGFYRPEYRDFPGIIAAFIVLSLGAHLVNTILRNTVCPQADYFFTYGADISVLNMLWSVIPIPYVYLLPALAVLLAYMGAITLGFNTVDRLREDSAVTAEQ